MDGDTTETNEATDPSTEPVGTADQVGEEQPGEAQASEERATEEQATEEKVSSEQMVGYLRKAHFEGTRGRRGYHQGEVNALLLRLIEAVEEGEPLGDIVRRTQPSQVRLEDGYDISQVDDFLAAVVDLDPNKASKPEVARSGLVAKLFG